MTPTHGTDLSMQPAYPAPDFDLPYDRRGTLSDKFDARAQVFGRSDVLPLWVADMDFAAPAPVLSAIHARLTHPIFGYTGADPRLLDAIVAWFEGRHGWRIDEARLSLAPGVVASLYACVQALSEEGDTIIVPSPVYPPFFGAVEASGRALVTSPLVAGEHGMTFDLQAIEDSARAGAKMLLLCSPHNPVGRVWRESELRALIDIAVRYGVTIVSDDIHADLVFPGHRHIPMATLAPPELRLVTAIAASKTFNIPALQMSALVFSHAEDQRALTQVFQRRGGVPVHPLTHAAVLAAYTECGPWLDALLVYLDGNRRWLHTQIETMEGITAALPEATCLTWLDARGLGLAPAALRRFFIEDARLGLNEGRSFGTAGAGFMRMNFGTQRAVLEQAVELLRAALARR